MPFSLLCSDKKKKKKGNNKQKHLKRKEILYKVCGWIERK